MSSVSQDAERKIQQLINLEFSELHRHGFVPALEQRQGQWDLQTREKRRMSKRKLAYYDAGRIAGLSEALAAVGETQETRVATHK